MNLIVYAMLIIIIVLFLAWGMTVNSYFDVKHDNELLKSKIDTLEQEQEFQNDLTQMVIASKLESDKHPLMLDNDKK